MSLFANFKMFDVGKKQLRADFLFYMRRYNYKKQHGIRRDICGDHCIASVSLELLGGMAGVW